MLKTIIGGIAIGISNVIPGVSGGTMMVILGIFHRITESITGIFAIHNKNRKADFIFLLTLAIGILLGTIGFAKLLTFFFANFPIQTYYWFIGMVVFSIPIFLNSELQGEKLHFFAIALGMGIIFLIQYLNPGKAVVLSTTFPELNSALLLRMVIIGCIGGFTMLLPGVSGSMVLLILGQYQLFLAYLANITTLRIDVIFPLGAMAFGIFAGIFLASLLTKWAMAKHRRITVSFLLGLIAASSIVLIPINVAYNFSTILTSILTIAFGGAMVTIIGKYS